MVILDPLSLLGGCHPTTSELRAAVFNTGGDGLSGGSPLEVKEIRAL